MKLTKQQLKQLIKEELQNVLQEQAGAGGEEEEFEYAPWFSKKGQSRGLPPPRVRGNISGGTRAQSPARYWSWLDQRLDRMEMKILDALYTMGRASAP